MHNPLLDKVFLKALDETQHKEVWVKIIALNNEELPIETIEGKISTGSLNIDGNSAIRRTCNLTMIASDININEFYWGIKNKFKLEIGLTNHLSNQYPEIIWFKQGIFIITSFNTSISANGYSITISGKDKMCLLNGDMGGSLPASIDFNTIETVDGQYQPIEFEVNVDNKAFSYEAGKYYILINENNNTPRYELDWLPFDSNKTYYEKIGKQSTLEHLPIYSIIKEAVHTYGKEPYHNIIINDLEKKGLELLEYRGDELTPIYLLRNSNGEFQNLTINSNQQCKSSKDPDDIFEISEFLEGKSHYSDADKRTELNADALPVHFETYDWLNDRYDWSTELYTVAPMVSGETAGYRTTELTYPGELISSIGEALTSILDKIKNMLGNFEYFYDIDGRFIFQKKRTFINTNWDPIINTGDELYVENLVYANSPIMYNFEGNTLISSIQNSPVLNNLKNDYSVWGTKKSVTGQDLPIHVRYAIDKKPYSYTKISINETEAKNLIADYPSLYPTDNNLQEDSWKKYVQTSKTFTSDEYNWRELIYQMALDYYKYGQLDIFSQKVIAANRNKGKNNENLYTSGFTGYEQYYTDIISFWRELYDPEPEIKFNFTKGAWVDVRVPVNDQNNSNDYTMEKEWQDLEVESVGCNYYLSTEYYNQHNLNQYVDLNEKFDIKVSDSANKYWSRTVTDAPQNLNFWFEFLDTSNELEHFSVSTIGQRSKVVNDKSVKAVFYKEIPNIIYQNINDYDPTDRQDGYTYAFLPPQFENVFSISAQGKSAQDAVNELLYNHSYCIENITLTTVPIYYLEPNNRIYVYDKNSNINGQYIVSRLSISLTYNGTMSITATKAPERIL